MSAVLQIVQLYPAELGVTGDRGNVRALEVRAERAGLTVQTTRVGIGEPLPADADIIVIGNGPLSAMRGVHADLQARHAGLAAAIADGVVVLAVGAGAELLSMGVELLDGQTVEGLGVLPFRVERTRDRRVGYVIATTPHGRLIGFEDHASTWVLAPEAQVYGEVTAGIGSFILDSSREGAPRRGETVRHENAFATNVQGPVLPLNPQLADELLRAAAARRGLVYETATGHAVLDELAAGARSAIEGRIDVETFTYMKV